MMVLALTEFVDQMATSYAGLSKHHIRAFTDLLSREICPIHRTLPGDPSRLYLRTRWPRPQRCFLRHQALATTRAKVLRALDEALLSSKKTHKERTGSSSLSTSSLLASDASLSLRRLLENWTISTRCLLPSRGTLAERATRLVPD